METIHTIILSVFASGLFSAILIWLAKNWIYVRLTNAIKHEYDGKLEVIRNQYARVLENLSYENRLRMAALDRRLETHQQAFTLWHRLAINVFKQELVNQVATECQEWWSKNCLYLDTKSRDAFLKAVRAAVQHQEIARDRGQSSAESYKATMENWNRIMEASDAIVQGVALPPIHLDQIEAVKQNAPQQ